MMTQLKDWNDATRAGVSALAAADAAWARPAPKIVAGPSWRDGVMTAAELQRRKFPPVSYVIPGLIPEGLTIAAGKPKVGKSWFGLDLAIAVAGGRYCLGDKKPATGDVLYAALEDNPRRLQKRIDKILSPVSTEWPARLTLTTAWRRLDKGGVADIGEWADAASAPRLVILDTLAGVRPIKTNSGYTEDYEALGALHRLANDRGLAVLVLHHTRKMEADDPLDTVSGTLGLAGAADTVMVLARSSQGTTLYVRGRDIEEAEHAINFDKELCRWTILGDAADVRRSDERTNILTALADAGGEPMGPAEIAEHTGMKPGNVRFLLHQMVRDSEVQKIGRGRYASPKTPEPEGATNFANDLTTGDPDRECWQVSDVRASHHLGACLGN